MKENSNLTKLEHKDFEIYRYENGHLLENCYFIKRKEEKAGIIIDPGLEVSKLLALIDENNFKISAILLTHGHFDHSYSVDNIEKKYGCDCFIDKLDEELMNDSAKNMAKSFFKNLIIKDFKVLNEKEIEICKLNIKVLNTPGHTKGSICYLIDDILFSGDTLFFKTFGRTDLFNGDFDEMKNSLLNILFKLDDNILVLPGHGKETTIGYEKINNQILEEV